jgi:hypothetical protein
MANDEFDNSIADKKALEEFVTIPQIKTGCPHKLGDSCKYPACVRGGPPFTNEQCFEYIEGMK